MTYRETNPRQRAEATLVLDPAGDIVGIDCTIGGETLNVRVYRAPEAGDLHVQIDTDPNGLADEHGGPLVTVHMNDSTVAGWTDD